MNGREEREWGDKRDEGKEGGQTVCWRRDCVAGGWVIQISERFLRVRNVSNQMSKPMTKVKNAHTTVR